MAYVLGLIYTDGNLHIRKNKSGYELGILSFGQKDKELVEKFLNLMECDAKIRYRERQDLENTTSGELYFFSIANNDLSNDLLRLGVTQNKSLDMKFPEIPTDLIRHFIRGFFDGDGSVYLENKKLIRVKLLSGSKDFIYKLNEHMVNIGFSDRNINGGTPSTPIAFFIRYNSDNEVLRFYKYIYHDVSEQMYLLRKKEIFDQYFDYSK